MPYLIFNVNRPCWPRKISCRNVLIASQTIGLTSTPKAGGTRERVGRRSHSVGRTMKEKGGELRSDFGYHDITTGEEGEVA